MSATTQPDLRSVCRGLGDELYEVLQRLDPARARQSRVAEARARLRAAAERARTALSRADDDPELAAWCEGLVATASEADKLDTPSLRQRVTAAYDALNARLRARGAEVQRHRPTNYLRNAYHVGNGLMIIWLIQFILTPWTMILVAGGFAVAAWTAELSRRRSRTVNRLLMRAFRDVAHPDEHYRVNSATWMVTALLLIALLFDPLACTVGVAVLGFADPAAAIIGRRFGRRRLVGSKTLEGTLAFALAGAAAGVACIALFGPAWSWPMRVGVALCAAAPAAIAELYAGTLLDDNFIVPTVATAGAWLGALALA